MMDIAFDIETIRNGSMIDKLPELEIKLGNLKDPYKIEEKKAEARAEQIRKMTLNPLYGRVCAFAVASDAEESAYCIDADSDEADTELIERAFTILSGNRIVTYNGKDFDLPFLYRRAVILGISPQEFNMPTLAKLTDRYKHEFHVDTMSVWCGFGNYEKLDNISRVLSEDSKIEIDFNDFPELIKTSDGREQIKTYNLKDAKLTMAFWNRISGILI